MEKTCLHCQKVFEVKRVDSVYCSRSCRQMAYMNRKLIKLTSVIAKYPVVSEANEKSTQHSFDNGEPEAFQETTIDGPEEFVSDFALKTETKQPTIDFSKASEIESNKKIEDPVFIQSKFIDALIELNNDRLQLSALNQCLAVKQDLPSYWVSTRLRCLIECLLVFSEMKYTHVADLMEICNAFTVIIRSTYFKTLPGEFPYRVDVLRLKEKLKRMCILVQNCQQVKFRFNQNDKLELMMIRYELAQFVSRKQFKQLDF